MNVNALRVIKSTLKANNKLVLNMEIDESHLSLMSYEILYGANNPTNERSSFTLHAADVDNVAGPSS